MRRPPLSFGISHWRRSMPTPAPAPRPRRPSSIRIDSWRIEQRLKQQSGSAAIRRAANTAAWRAPLRFYADGVRHDGPFDVASLRDGPKVDVALNDRVALLVARVQPRARLG